MTDPVLLRLAADTNRTRLRDWKHFIRKHWPVRIDVGGLHSRNYTPQAGYIKQDTLKCPW